jgi:hypothetical protein
MQIGLGLAITNNVTAAREPSLSSPSFALRNTTVTNDETSDGENWAQAGDLGPIIIGLPEDDLVTYTQRNNGGSKSNYFVISVNGGLTWFDNTGISGGEAFLERGTIAYDATRDCFHGLLITTNPGDGGVIYRRYSITRDGSNNITSIARVAGVSVVLDGTPSEATQYQHPIIQVISNTLVASWNARNASKNEIRAVRCNIGSDADAGGTASNWVHLGVNSATTISQSPQTASYTALVANATGGISHHAIYHKSNGDLQIIYHDGDTPGQWRMRRAVWGGSSWTSLSTDTLVSNVRRAGAGTGYNLKGQLLSKIVVDGAGNLYVGLATWKDDTSGDTWGYARIDSSDVVTLVDVYSAGGSHSYAPAGDLEYDSTADRLIASYIKTSTQHAYVRLYNGITAAAAEVLAFNGDTVDIPLIRSRLNGKLLMLFREATGTAPFAGYFGTLTWG